MLGLWASRVDVMKCAAIFKTDVNPSPIGVPEIAALCVKPRALGQNQIAALAIMQPARARREHRPTLKARDTAIAVTDLAPQHPRAFKIAQLDHHRSLAPKAGTV